MQSFSGLGTSNPQDNVWAMLVLSFSNESKDKKSVDGA